MNDEEINTNFIALSDMVKESIIANELEKHEEALSFTPNDFAKSLDITALEAPKNGADYQLIIAICVSTTLVIIAVVSIFIFRSIRAKRFHKKLKNKKNNHQRLK